MNYYEHHIGDFRSGSVNMTRQERWIYRDLIEVYYDTEQPLSPDLEKLCKDIGVRGDEEKAIVRELLAYKFKLTERGYEHGRCESVIADYRAKATVARENGKKGGRPRKPDGNPEKPSGLIQVSKNNPVETGLKANQKPVTTNQEPKEVKPLSGSPDDLPKAMLEYLNLKTGHSYKPVESNLKMLRARFAEGATEDECRSVIDAKVSQWVEDPKMAEYLRPATLFNATNYAQYAGQLEGGGGGWAVPEKQPWI